MFANMDTDNSGTITYEELKSGLARLGSKLSETEVKQLMEAVSIRLLLGIFHSKWGLTAFLHFTKCAANIRLMWTAMGPSTTLNLLLLPCTDTGLKRMSICLVRFSILTRIAVGKI